MKKFTIIFVLMSLISSLFFAVYVYSDGNTVIKDGITYGFYDTYSAVESCDTNKSGLADIAPSVRFHDAELPVTGIKDRAFSDCVSVSYVFMPDSLTYIGEEAFLNCVGISSVNIPNKVTSIVYCTFDGCTSLKNVTVPKSVTSIKSYAFNDCTSIEKAYYFGTEEDWKSVDVSVGNKQLTSHIIYHPEHSFGYEKVIKEATQTEDGLSEHTCSVCGYKETFITKKLEERISGDIDGDGFVSNRDVVELFRYVSSQNKLNDESIYDFNKDGKVNNKDVVALFRRVSTL